MCGLSLTSKFLVFVIPYQSADPVLAVCNGEQAIYFINKLPDNNKNSLKNQTSSYGCLEHTAQADAGQGGEYLPRATFFPPPAAITLTVLANATPTHHLGIPHAAEGGDSRSRLPKGHMTGPLCQSQDLPA
ncbi:hypothetical protein JB92DRAFT_2832861 [Gautieria morchelliformis]|nr:hypothetical protein JB92DRAFT_2832861 [Gautieria morchelliformis]